MARIKRSLVTAFVEIVSIGWAFLAISGCSTSSSTQSSPMPTIAYTSVLTHTPNNPTTTPTHIPSPTVTPSPTATVSSFNIRVPIIKITEQEMEQLRDILAGDEDCQLPCWGGITPGRTHVDELPTLLGRIGIDVYGEIPEISISGKKFIPINFSQSSASPTLLYVTPLWSDEVIEEIELTYYDARYIQPQRLQFVLGEPRVLLFKAEMPPSGDYNYRIMIGYPDQGVLAVMNGWTSADLPKEIVFSPQSVSVTVLLHAVGDRVLLEKVASDGFSDPEIQTGMDASAFWSALVNGIRITIND